MGQSSKGSACSTTCQFKATPFGLGRRAGPAELAGVQLAGPGHHWTQLGVQQHTGPLARSGEWEQVRDDEKRGWGYNSLCCSGDTRPSGGGGLWHTCWHPGFQSPRQGVMLLPALGGETGERRVGSKGPERDSTKLVRQAGTPGGEAWWCPCSRHSALPGL